MAQSVLGSISLGYRPLWNRARALGGLQLFVHEDEHSVDGHHLLRTLAELWSAESPSLVLSVRSRALLLDLLAHVDANDPIIEIPFELVGQPATRAALARAKQRGAHLMLGGTPQDAVDPESARWFERRALSLSAVDAATSLQAVLQLRQAAAAGRVGGRSESSPVKPNAVVEGVASRALADHALDQQGAWAVAGWPVEDMLHRYDGQTMPLSRRAIVQVMNALDEEQSLERIDLLLGQEPALAYRVLLYLNSAGLGLRSGVSSLRHGLMMLGFRKLNAWLAEQLPSANEDPNLRPVNAAMVMRGHLMEHLMDSGIEDELRREISLCGLFSQLDLLLNEPLRVSFARIPLSERIVAATVTHTGPYAPALQIAGALESANPALLRSLRVTYEIGAEEVNRALLKTFATMA